MADITTRTCHSTRRKNEFINSNSVLSTMHALNKNDERSPLISNGSLEQEKYLYKKHDPNTPKSRRGLGTVALNSLLIVVAVSVIAISWMCSGILGTKNEDRSVSVAFIGNSSKSLFCSVAVDDLAHLTL